MWKEIFVQGNGMWENDKGDTITIMKHDKFDVYYNRVLRVSRPTLDEAEEIVEAFMEEFPDDDEL